MTTTPIPAVPPDLALPVAGKGLDTGVDWYALVIIEGFQVSGVTAFPAAPDPICRGLYRDRAGAVAGPR
jgi:hypothetical protein